MGATILPNIVIFPLNRNFFRNQNDLNINNLNASNLTVLSKNDLPIPLLADLCSSAEGSVYAEYPLGLKG